MENNVKIPHLCSADECTACSACYNVCPRDAITIKVDCYGESHPDIDTEKCIHCGLCEKVCPGLDVTKLQRNGKPTVYCCWLKDSGLRKECTSGGAAFAISRAIIRKGGHVWGAAYNEHMDVTYTEANSITELSALQKSKYAQCIVDDAFRKIKKELEAGDIVLFAGTGCHVMGLKAYLRKDYANLYTLDLVCHGVPGQGVFKKYKEWLENKYNDSLISYIPRPKRQRDGQELCWYAQARFRHKGDMKLVGLDNSYFLGFQHNLFLRAACHDCCANGEERYSDFTVADFWGLGKVTPFKPYKERTLGISMLALNSEKAKLLFDDFKNDLVYEMRSYKEASFSNTQYYKSAIPSPFRAQFRNDFDKLSWEELANRYMHTSLKEKVLYGIKRFMPPICYYMLNYWRNG